MCRRSREPARPRLESANAHGRAAREGGEKWRSWRSAAIDGCSAERGQRDKKRVGYRPPLRIRVRAILCAHANERELSGCSFRSDRILGPVHANYRLALATRRAERKEWDEGNTRRIHKEHDAAIGPSGGQPHEGFLQPGERALPAAL